MKYCPSCGTGLPDNAHFCGHCGYTLDATRILAKATNKRQPLAKHIKRSAVPIADAHLAIDHSKEPANLPAPVQAAITERLTRVRDPKPEKPRVSSQRTTKSQAITWGWLPALILTSALGVFLLALAYESGRLAAWWADPLFWFGLLVIFIPIAWRLLLIPKVTWQERIARLRVSSRVVSPLTGDFTKNTHVNFGMSLLLFFNGLALCNLFIFFPMGIVSTIFVGLYISFVPGLLILAIVQKQITVCLEESMYSVGLSLSFLMLLGLAINWLFPIFGIIHPISLIPLAFTFSALVSLLLALFFIRKPIITVDNVFPKWTKTHVFFILYSLLLPVLSILGANLLNNGGSNIIVLFLLGNIAICFFSQMIFQKKIDAKISILTLLCSTIALLLSTSLRSQYLSGHDVITEYFVFHLVKTNGYWNVSLFKDPYNACLSITILPAIYDAFLKINDQYIFKAIFQLIFSLTTPMVYLFLRKFLGNPYALIGSFFYISQYAFVDDFPFLTRQEIGQIYFSLVLLVLFNTSLQMKVRKFLLVLFLVSMVLAHYTTTYVAIGLFVITYVLYFIFTKVVPRSSFMRTIMRIDKTALQSHASFLLTPVTIIFLIGITFLWNSEITGTTRTINNFISQIIQKEGEEFTSSARTGQTSIIDQFNIFYKAPSETTLLIQYISSTNNMYNNFNYIHHYPESAVKTYQSYVDDSALVPFHVQSKIAAILNFISDSLNKLIKVLIVIGIIYSLFIKKKKTYQDVAITAFIIAAQIVLLLFLAIADATVDYSVLRLFQQILIILVLPTLWGTFIFEKFIPQKTSFLALYRYVRNGVQREGVKTRLELASGSLGNIPLHKIRYGFHFLLIVLVFGSYYLSNSSIIPQLTGGNEAKLHLNNTGFYYDEYYTHSQEIAAGEWLNIRRDKYSLVYADPMTLYRMRAFANISPKGFATDVLPSIIDEEAYVFASYTQAVQGRIIQFFNGNIVEYNYPTNFLDQNKNLIYNNGGSKIYK